MIIKDLLGKEVQVNDWIAVSFREGNNSVLRIGRVKGFGRRNLAGSRIATIAVEWYISSSVLLPAKATNIDSGSAKFIVIPSPIEDQSG